MSTSPVSITRFAEPNPLQVAMAADSELRLDARRLAGQLQAMGSVVRAVTRPVKLAKSEADEVQMDLRERALILQQIALRLRQMADVAAVCEEAETLGESRRLSSTKREIGSTIRW